VLGIGAWSWGDRSGYWGYGREYGQDASREAYDSLMAAGLSFIDTAEVQPTAVWVAIGSILEPLESGACQLPFDADNYYRSRSAVTQQLK
jgi:hypothetical protein